MSYNGTTKIGDELAKLLVFSPKSGNNISKLMSEARKALKLGNAKRLTPEQNIAIWQYHSDKVQGVNIPTDDGMNIPIVSKGSDMNIPTNSLPDNCMNIPTQQACNITVPLSDNVNIPTNSIDGDVNIPLSDSMSIPIRSKHQKPTDGAFKLINFSIKLADRRTVVSLEAYLVEALKAKFALQTNSQIRRWIESTLTDDNFDNQQPITRQIKYLIVQGLIND